VIKAFGVGLNEADTSARFVRAGDFDCVLLAGRYTLLEQGALSDFLPLCEQKGVGVIIGGPLNSGILATGARDGARYNYQPPPLEVLEKVKKLSAVCDRHGVELPAAACADLRVLLDATFGARTDLRARAAAAQVEPDNPALFDEIYTATTRTHPKPAPAVRQQPHDLATV